MNKLKVIGGRHSHDTLRLELAKLPRGKILDVPAGSGVLSRYLLELGWEVHCADIDPGHFQLQGVPFQSANLNRDLPFAGESFDAILCANGLHRLYNPSGAIREFFRILKPGGTLHININNYSSITKRLRFLLYGSITNTINESRYAQTTNDPEANVRHHLFYPQLHNMLIAEGFEVCSLKKASVKVSHRLLLPVAWIIRLAALLISPKRRQRCRIRETNSGAICPGGKYLYVAARKPMLS